MSDVYRVTVGGDGCEHLARDTEELRTVISGLLKQNAGREFTLHVSLLPSEVLREVLLRNHGKRNAAARIVAGADGEKNKDDGQARGGNNHGLVGTVSDGAMPGGES